MTLGMLYFICPCTKYEERLKVSVPIMDITKSFQAQLVGHVHTYCVLTTHLRISDYF